MIHKINRAVFFQDLGLVDYKEAWVYQESLFNQTVELKIQNRSLPEELQFFTPNHLVFCEHPHVFTLGKSGKEAHLLIDEKMLNSIDAQFYQINRGGDITYHGPGQLVGYPIFDLENFFTDIHKYLRFLEEAVILTLSYFGVQSGRVDGLTGVWVNEKSKAPRKICALGVKASRWVTMHGFAFNLNSDLSFFKHIVPCGIPDKEVTSLQNELGEKVNIGEVQNILLRNLQEVFQFQLVPK